jgi:hypothetical protein
MKVTITTNIRYTHEIELPEELSNPVLEDDYTRIFQYDEENDFVWDMLSRFLGLCETAYSDGWDWSPINQTCEMEDGKTYTMKCDGV